MTDVGRTSGAALMQPALQLSPMQDTRVDLRSERRSSRSDVRFMRVGGKVGAGGGSWLAAASNDGGGSFGTKPYYQRESEKTKPVTTQERDQRVIPIRQPQSNPTVENTHFPLLLRSLDRVLEHVVRCVQSTSPTSRAPSSL